MMSAEEDSTSSPDDDPYDDTDILNSAGTDEVTAHLAAAGIPWLVDHFVCNQYYNCIFISYDYPNSLIDFYSNHQFYFT